MADHVVVGAGLGGLYTVFRLINKGIKPENIVIIEKRQENHYTRPGHLNHEIFELVTQNTNVPTPHSAAHHIKDLERVLYDNLKRLKVRFIDEEFVELQAQTETQTKAVITRKKDNSPGVYPADFVFDCSGRKAFVAQAVNEYQQSINATPAFKTGSLVDINPIPYHLIAHVQIPNNTSLISFMSREAEAVPSHVQKGSLQKNIELRERLKTLGWTYEAFPTFYTYSQETKDKVCLYMETPPHLAQNQQREWIQLLLDIYSEGIISDYAELKPSRKYGEKPRIISFQSVPYVLNKIIHETANLPVVIMGFDAVKGYDYRLAHGVKSGITCCEYMLEELTIRDGSIQAIDAAAIERKTFAYINGHHKTHLTSTLMARQNAIGNAFDYFSRIYEKALSTVPSVESAKRQTYQAIAGELAYQAVTIQYPKSETRERTEVASLEALNNCLSVLVRAHATMPACKTYEHHDVNTKLLSIVSEMRVELNAFDITQFLNHPTISYERLRTLFESIEKNFQTLDGFYASSFLRSKTKSILEQIPQRPVQTNRVQVSFSFLLNSPELLFQLSNFFGPGAIRVTMARGGSFFSNRSDVVSAPPHTNISPKPK